MKKILILLAFILAPIVQIMADEVYISVAMQANSILDSNAKTILKNKIVSMVTSDGIAATEYSAIAVVPEISVMQKDKVEGGMRTITSMEINITLTVRNVVTGNVFNSVQISAKGNGYSEADAIKNAIRTTDISDSRYGAFISEAKRRIVEYYKTNTNMLITKANSHYQEVLACVKGIIGQLERLIDDAKNLRRNPDLRAERTAAMEAYYTKRLWPKHKEQLEARIDAELKDDDNKGLTPTKIIKAMIKDMEADYERTRDEQTFDGMMRLMQHRQSIKYLETRIVAIAMKAPCDAYEGKLFTSKAAYELAKLMGKAFYNYVGFDKKIKSCFICAAMMDFNLMQKDCNNTRLVVEFINNELLGDKDDKVNKDAIIKPLRKCSGKPFCTIDEDNLRDFTKDEFAKYKDLYWRSFSIINKVIGVGDKMVKAAYLDELHEVIEETDVFSYLNDDEMTRLNLLSSVIKQKWV